FLETSKTPNDSTPVILFVHGAPGAAGMYDRFLMDGELLEKAILISVDRLGYGHSGLGNAETSFAKQAEQLHNLISQYPNREVVAVGHSFGGPIITQLAIDYPNDVAGLVLLAPALDPEQEKYQGLAKIAKWKLTRWYFPELIRVSADEKLTHVAELEKMKKNIGQVNLPVLHIHGDKDSVVPYGNLAFSEEHFNPAILQTVTFPGADHFLIEKADYPQTKQALLQFIDELDF
ncbi:MAG: alpha/beta hydrolase, partial [Bacteroidota bacterium]